ncbi:MAG: glycoside hydrolase family 36 N-terminal domain-containing protein, partial [Bryobacteraceae bacterium]
MGLAFAASTTQAQAPKEQTGLQLRSGGVEYRLARSGTEVRLEYFGPAGKAAWAKPRGLPVAGDLQGRIQNQPISAASMNLVAEVPRTLSPGVEELDLTYRHRTLPFELHAIYTAWGDTGVFTRRLVLINTGERALSVNSLASLAWQLPPGAYRLDYLWGGWGQERQLHSEKLGPGARVFSSARGRSTELYSPWFALFNNTLGVGYAAQLAWSGNWSMSFERAPGSGSSAIEDSPLNVVLRVQFDSDGALTLEPGVPFKLPEVAFTATALAPDPGDLDDLANRLHRYQRQYVFAHHPANTPPLVQFNSWYPYQGKVHVDELKRCADSAAALGAEA